MRHQTTLSIPQPCSESWAAMTPAAQGRHCAACAKTVVDFTLKTDAEILAYLTKAAGSRTCGRFAAGQLERPLQRAAPAAPTARWRTWLAAAVAVWGLRDAVGVAAKAQAATEWRARYWGGPAPVMPPAEAKGRAMEEDNLLVPGQAKMGAALAVAKPAVANGASQAAEGLVVRGMVTDVATNQELPGVAILIKGTKLGIATDSVGAFKLELPAQFAGEDTVCLVVSTVGYMTQERLLSLRNIGASQQFKLQIQVMGLLEISVMPPAPWHPRSLYYWGKYWITRPFQRN